MDYDVAVTACSGYGPEECARALGEVLGPLGGLDWVTPGMKIAVKVNLVMAKSPDHGATTHPALVCALCDMLAARGAEVVVLTSAENPFLVREVSRSGVLAIVRKSAPSHEILEVIARVARGEPAATTEWAVALDSDPELRAAPLTAREREVLALYATGLGAKAVAARLHVSENTVADHLRRIRSVYAQLSRPASTKVELYQRGIEDGFLPPPAS